MINFPLLPYAAEGLKHVTVGSYKEIDDLMKKGLANRTVSSISANTAAASLAHTVAGIHFLQTGKGGEERTRLAVINLVDLAGTRRGKTREGRRPTV